LTNTQSKKQGTLNVDFQEFFIQALGSQETENLWKFFPKKVHKGWA
jgi:hypothetical protein